MKAAGADAIYVTDDLGTQTGPFFSPDIFEEYYLPCYKREIGAAHEMGMHFWLHSCGDIGIFLPRLIGLGLDVIHPIQKFAMDSKETVAKFGGQICFWAGFDVQHILQEEDTEGVRKEVRFLIDTFDRPDGGMCIGAGNGIVSGTPFENIEAFLDESIRYGIEHRASF